MSYKNILIVGADPERSTDGMIVRGTRTLLKETLISPAKYTFVDVDETEDQSPEWFKGGYDLIVVAGTPWLWDHFYNTVKAKNLVECIKANPNAKRVFFGIGSCLPLGKFDSHILRNKKSQDYIRKFFSGALLIVRDSLAQDLLQSAGLGAILLPCPAYYSVDHYHNPKDNYLIWYDPCQGISKSGWPRDSDDYREYAKRFYDYNAKYKPKVYCVYESEIPSALAAGLPKPEVIKGPSQTAEIASSASRMLTGRVHIGLPAAALGANVELLAVDSRYLTLAPYSRAELGKARGEYRKHMQRYLYGKQMVEKVQG